MVDKIYSKIAAKFDQDIEVIERISRSQFEFTASTIEQGEFQSIRLHHLGVYGVKPKRLEDINKNKKCQI